MGEHQCYIHFIDFFSKKNATFAYYQKTKIRKVKNKMYSFTP